MISASLIVLAATATAPTGQATALVCSLELPNGSPFSMKGHFNNAGLHSNLSALTKMEGVFVAAPAEPIIITDGTESRRWQLDKGGSKFDASLTRYGLEDAVLLLEKRQFIGRHWGRSLLGVGLCKLQPGETGGNAS